MTSQQRILHHDWRRYDTRQAVFKPKGMSVEQLEQGYVHAYREFYSWRNIARASTHHASWSRSAKHLAYSGGWKRLEPMWDFAIRSRSLQRMRPLLERVLATVQARASPKRAPSGGHLPVVNF